MIRLAGFLLLTVAGLSDPRPVRADEITIAVATNFLNPLRLLATEFEAHDAHETIVVSGSTGQLYAQILNGAPYDLLLAADRERPRLLAESGTGIRSTLFTYAVGQLALWSADPELIGDDTLGSLDRIGFRWFAIAEPRVAPYGAAAQQVLENLGSWQLVEGRLVRGQNVAQAFAMIRSGSAELGLVALSQALSYDGQGSYRPVPASLHDPIRQDAILLARAADNPAAGAFLDFLQSADAAAILSRFGYLVPGSRD